jgi:hypothetical protein
MSKEIGVRVIRVRNAAKVTAGDPVKAGVCTDLDVIRGMALADATDATRRAAAAVAAAAHGEPNTARHAALATVHATLVRIQADLERLR